MTFFEIAVMRALVDFIVDPAGKGALDPLPQTGVLHSVCGEARKLQTLLETCLQIIRGRKGQLQKTQPLSRRRPVAHGGAPLGI